MTLFLPISPLAYFCLVLAIINCVARTTSQTIQFCEIYLDSSQRCLRCADRYILSYDSMKCSPQSSEKKNCIQLGLFNECILCECGYSLISWTDTCQESLPTQHGCSVTGGENCLSPKEEFELIIIDSHPSQQLASRIEFSQGNNCQIRRANGECSRCLHGYQLSDINTCVKVPYEIVNSMYSYYMDTTLISKDIRLVGIKHGLYPVIENCVEHVLSTDGLSVKCAQCTNGRVLNASRIGCFKSPIDLCKIVSDVNLADCLECRDNDNYYLASLPNIGTKCLPRHKSYYNGCVEYQSRLNECAKCRQPYQLKDKRCVMEIQTENHEQSADEQELILNCLVYDTNGLCIECDTQSTLLTNGMCAFENDSYCVLQSVDGQCQRCIQGMVIDQFLKKCRFDEDACLQRDEQGDKCLLCREGFYINEIGRCNQIYNCKVSNGIDQVCLACNNLSYQASIDDDDDDQALCQPITNYQFCFKSNGITDECLVCETHFRLSLGGICEPEVIHSSTECEVYGFYLPPLGQRYCLKHSEQVKLDCLALDPKHNRCLACLDHSSLNVETGTCMIVPNCSLASKIAENVCLKSYELEGFLHENGRQASGNKMNCLTNQRDPICIKVDGDGAIEVSLYIRKGKNLTEFNKAEFINSAAAQNCFILELTDSSEFRCVQCVNMYFISTKLNQTGICEQVTLRMCTLSDGKKNECLSCEKDYVIDRTTGQCVGIVSKKINRCIQYFGQKCIKCQSLFQPSSNGYFCTRVTNPMCVASAGIDDQCTCSQFITNNSCQLHFCAEKDEMSGLCRVCLPGYALSEIQKVWPYQNTIDILCIQQSQTHCKHVSKHMRCETCEDGYFLSPYQEQFNNCQLVTVPHCLKMKDYTFKCIECKHGYFASKKGACVQVPHCLTFDQKCTSCESLYILNARGTCSLIAHCIQVENNVCVHCESTYYLSDRNTHCLPMSNCALSDGILKVCSICSPSFILISSGCLPVNPIKNCEEYQDTACLKCRSRYYLTKNYTCELITLSQHCLVSDGIHDECSQCEKQGFVLKSSTTSKLCDKIPECVISDGLSSCYLCRKMFYVSSDANTCITRNPIDKCKYYSSMEPSCEQCESLYYLANENMSCHQLTHTMNCFASDGIKNECMVCMNIGKNIYGVGIQRLRERSEGFENIFSRCHSVNASVDSVCSPNHFQSYHKCYPRISYDNCERFHSHIDECEVCKHGYVLRNEPDLPYGSYCEVLPVTDVVENCVEYATIGSSHTTVCIKCTQSSEFDIIEYWLDRDSNTCVNVLSQTCLFTEQNLKHDQPLVCIKHIPHCQVEQPSGCVNCTEILKCSRCKNGYYLLQNECMEHVKIEHCVKYHNQTKDKCSFCKTGYMGDTCERSKYQDTCAIYSVNNNLCSQCKEGYAFLYDYPDCFPNAPPNCIRLALGSANQHICSRCKKNYVFGDDRLCVREPIKDENCRSVNSNECVECKPGYFPNKQYGCLKQNSVCAIKSCVIYAEESMPDLYKCAKCADGYRLDKLQQCVAVIHNDGSGNNDAADVADDGQIKESELDNKLDPKKNEADQTESSQQNSFTKLLLAFTCTLIGLAAVIGLIVKRLRHRKALQGQNDQSVILQLSESTVRDSREVEQDIDVEQVEDD